MLLRRSHNRLRLPVNGIRMMSTSDDQLFDKILIANRGEIACRVMDTAKRMGIRTVAVYSDADVNSLHVQKADEAHRLGPPLAAESYLLGDKILEVAAATGAQAIHPGYGFLSENAGFARRCAEEGVTFIGPPATAIDAMGSKSESKKIMIDADVPVTPGYHGEDQSLSTLKAEAEAIGYPVMIKAVLGGGGKGMRIAHTAEEFEDSLDACKREAMASFSDDIVLLEKYVVQPRHVEFQVFADSHGNAVHLFERDCSVQRRHQKVLEEAPAPGMTPELRASMGASAVAAAQAVGYVGAGTVEFILTPDRQHYFMEMNTRLQVEHPVTELVSGQDLVEWQLKVAAGQALPLSQEELGLTGHALEARIYAERPHNNFLPATGHLLKHAPPASSDTVRVDSGIRTGDTISTYYDPMIAKLITHGENRMDALQKMDRALEQYDVVGLPTNIAFLRSAVKHPAFVEGGVDTGFLDAYLEDIIPPPAQAPAQVVAMAAVGNLYLAAAKTAAAAAKSADPFSPWATGTSSRPTGSLAANFSLTDEAGEERTAVIGDGSTVGGYSVAIGDDSLDLKSVTPRPDLSDTSFTFDFGDSRLTAEIVLSKDGYTVTVLPRGGFDASAYTFELPVPDYSGGAGASGALNVMTPMPGRVIKVMAQPGDEVEAGQTLMILEAMKMEHTIKAPGAGTIEAVNFRVDDLVNDGQVLVSFAEESEE